MRITVGRQVLCDVTASLKVPGLEQSIYAIRYFANDW